MTVIKSGMRERERENPVVKWQAEENMVLLRKALYTVTAVLEVGSSSATGCNLHYLEAWTVFVARLCSMSNGSQFWGLSGC